MLMPLVLAPLRARLVELMEPPVAGVQPEPDVSSHVATTPCALPVDASQEGTVRLSLKELHCAWLSLALSL